MQLKAIVLLSGSKEHMDMGRGQSCLSRRSLGLPVLGKPALCHTGDSWSWAMGLDGTYGQ